MNIKKILYPFVSFVLSLFAFTGCIVIPIDVDYEFSVDSVMSVEIYDLRENELAYIDFEKDKPVFEVTRDLIPSFIEDFNKIDFCNHYIITLAAIDPSFNFSDWVVRINHTDGTFDLISSGGLNATYDENNEQTNGNFYCCEEDDWLNFIRKYVPKEIFESNR